MSPRGEESSADVSSGLWGRLERHPAVRRGRLIYRRYERWTPILFFFGGVTWDAVTLQRIDAWFDNLFLLSYLLLVGLLIVVALLVESGSVADSWYVAYRNWYPPAIQFFLGALFSAYVVFYFQSASLSQSSLFLGLLVVLLVGNEFFHRRLFNLYLLVALYFLACFSFFIFFIPVVVKVMNYTTFLIGGVLSVGWVAGIILFLRGKGVFAQWEQFAGVAGLVLALFGTLHLFYVQNWIPPVPLAMRYGGVYHSVERVDDAYELRGEPPAWYAVWRSSSEHFRYTPGDTVYAFAAVFAPTQLRKQIYHEWSYYDEDRRAWVATDRIGYAVVGGRYGGYRGYTYKRHLRPGRWRVNVQTEEGLIVGRIRFVVEPVDRHVTGLKTVTYR